MTQQLTQQDSWFRLFDLEFWMKPLQELSSGKHNSDDGFTLAFVVILVLVCTSSGTEDKEAEHAILQEIQKKTALELLGTSLLYFVVALGILYVLWLSL
ncbi:hypothetical protein Pla110_03760 [Polystyrenella longa]|uniref:Uncharacterized protein n=1 Tax=Polystyrenella longa TaxID=2528007 RepID=A0A518CHG7_9PLAN|nr:hypothetical protein [Polystyrenella longa]QDU78672.1 hypothetical protein Pla110_03760 [Polystyrenella longa]